jgi:hypothetical protein
MICGNTETLFFTICNWRPPMLLIMREAQINDAMTKLYKNVERYSADHCWYFDIPLAI